MTLSQLASVAVVVADVLIVVVLVPRVVSQRRESAATLAWVLSILLVPLAGAALFHLLGTRRLRWRQRRRARSRALFEASAEPLRTTLATCQVDVATDRAALALARNFGVAPDDATVGNVVDLYHDGEEAFRALCEAVAGAQRYVHLEYYIFQDDETGRRLLAILAERARAGVEVRLLVDAVGSWTMRRRGVAADLMSAGGQFASFLPISVFSRPFSVNLRNHRKIVVIDGHVAFTGGMNIGDEYRSRDPRIGHWRDSQARVQGPAALRLHEVFIEDWLFATGERVFGPRYLVAPDMPGDVVVEVIESGPDRTSETIYRRLFVAITRAEKRVWLTTPYFIPDQAILVALATAAQRGVDVRLLLPGWSDQPLALYAGRAHYTELLRSGARVYEYAPGMLHAKTMVVDDQWVTIGSANMDRRSFHLNWEANLVLLDRGINEDMARRFEQDLTHATEIRSHRPRRLRRFGEAVCYVLSPLL